jgi:hypothetical protein
MVNKSLNTAMIAGISSLMLLGLAPATVLVKRDSTPRAAVVAEARATILRAREIDFHHAKRPKRSPVSGETRWLVEFQ